MADNRNQLNSKGNQSWIIGLVVLAALLILGWQYYSNKQKEETLRVELEKKEAERMETAIRLEEISFELDQKIAELQELGADVEELQLQKENLEKQKEGIKRASYREIGKYKEQIKSFETMLIAKDQQLAELKEVNQALLVENTDLKTQTNVLSESINELSRTTEDLESKVAIASVLRAENILTSSINRNGKLKEEGDVLKKRNLDKIQVAFNLARNEVVTPGTKEIIIKIIEPNGEVLFDVATGSGTFLVDGREEFYTAKQDIIYDRSAAPMMFVYDKPSEFERGQHNLMIFQDGNLIGQRNFVVK